MLALLDGDIIAFRCAASCEPTKEKPFREPVEHAIGRADELTYRICNTVSSDEHRIFIGGSENFRKQWYPDYKAHRRSQPKPEYLDAVRNFLVEEWEAEVCAGYEADDGIGIAATGDFVICSIDKDLRQIPGNHYNFVKNEFIEISSEDAIRNFYLQMLTGDRSDNIKGIEGIGPVRGERILAGLIPEELETAVRECYSEAGRSREDYVLNYCLLRILRSEEELAEIETAIREGQGPFITKVNRFKNIEPVSSIDEE